MQFIYIKECYKHKWLLDYVNQQLDELAYKVNSIEKLGDRVFNYIGKFLLQDENNYKRRQFIQRLVKKKIKESLTRYAGINSSQSLLSFDYENSSDLVEYYDDKDVVRDMDFWIETLAGDNPKDRIIVCSLAEGNSIMETARILTEECGGKLNGNRTTVNRFKTNCINRKAKLLNTISY